MSSHPSLATAAIADRSDLVHRAQSGGRRGPIRDHQVMAFRTHAIVFAVGMALIVVVNLLTNLGAGIAGDWRAWWSVWALLGWGAGLAIHGLVLRLELARPASSPTNEVDR